MARWETTTWNDLIEIIKTNGFADDEYFSCEKKWREQIAWDDDTRWIAVYWVQGSNEGYYVHVDRIDRNGQGEIVLLGKFWDWRRAQAATMFIQYYVNFGRIPTEANAHQQADTYARFMFISEDDDTTEDWNI